MPKGVANKRYTPEFKKLVIETMQERQNILSIFCSQSLNCPVQLSTII